MIKKIVSTLDANYFFIFLLFYVTIFFHFYYQDNTFVGSKHDYQFHLKFIYLFKNNNLYEAIKLYGTDPYIARNSPVFYIIYGFLNKYLSLDVLQKLNTTVSILIAFAFFKCLKIKYSYKSNIFLSLLACIVFLSPSLRSLSIYPYPLTWGIFFFTLSIYYFLKFQNSLKKNFLFCIYVTIFVAVASYLHPTLSLFNIFYLISFYKAFKNKIEFYYILLLNLLLILPVIFLLKEIGFLFFYKGEGLDVSILKSINIFNKIIIISTIILYYIFPTLNLSELYNKVTTKINWNICIVAMLLTVIFASFFNYEYTTLFGGGFVHKISYLLFKNYIFLFIVFLFSILIFYFIFDDKINNYLIYSLIILTNIQYTIYNKYYDILVLIIFFLLAEINYKKFFFQKNNSIIYLYSIYFFYYTITAYKFHIYNWFS